MECDLLLSMLHAPRPCYSFTRFPYGSVKGQNIYVVHDAECKCGGTSVVLQHVGVEDGSLTVAPR